MSGNKTLMFYINSLNRGGAQRVLVQLAGRFADAGWHSVLVTSFVSEDEYPVPPGVERISIDRGQLRESSFLRNFSRIAALRALLRQIRPAALISFMAEPNFRAVLAARGLPVKTIVSVRNDPKREYGSRSARFVGQHILPRADGCVFQTREAMAWFPEAFQKKSAVIMNQVSERFFDTPPAKEHHDIVAVGRLNRQKNHALLVRAYAALGDVEDRLVLYGEGRQRENLEELVRSLHLEGRVLLPGSSDDVPRDIRGAKLFVLPSNFEGMPNALLEAMALGLPCISTDCPCGGPAEILENGTNGLLVPVGDEQALTEAMASLLADADKRAALAENARRTAESFRPELIFRRWEEYVESVIAGKERS